MTAPVLQLPVKVLRSATAGRRPGDGTFRALTDGELFVNTQDRVACMLDASGNLFAFPIDPNVLATQAFVTGNFGAANPSMAGTASPGSATTAARSDHVHPTDTTRAAVGNVTPVMDGTAAAGSAATAARSDHVHPTDTSRAALTQVVRNDAPQNPTAAQSAQALANIGILDPGISDGCCRLSVASATSLKLSRLNGSLLVVGGVQCTIPAAGVTLSGPSITASTLYYVYATASAGAINALVLSTTGHVTGADGREYLSNGAQTPAAVTSSRLVGMVYTTSSSQFSDIDTFRGCANWFNRTAHRVYETGSPTTSSGGNVTLLASMAFLCWGDEAFTTSISGYAYPSTSGASLQSQIQVDGANYTNDYETYSGTSAKSVSGIVSLVLSEGNHSVSLVGCVPAGGGSGNWQSLALSGSTRM